MKKLLLLSALAAAAFIDARPSEAYYHGAWCAKINIGGGVVQERCDFPNFETCRRYVSAQSTSFCVQNQYYLPYWGVEVESTPRRRARR